MLNAEIPLAAKVSTCRGLRLWNSRDCEAFWVNEGLSFLSCIYSGCVFTLVVKLRIMKIWLLSWIWPWRSRSINPPNNRDINQDICIFYPNFVVLAWTLKYGAVSWNHSSWETRTPLSYIVNSMTADALVAQEARASVAMSLTYFPQNISVSGLPSSFLRRQTVEYQWTSCLVIAL